jgi:hypothetical protein
MVFCKIGTNCCRVLAKLEAAGPIHPDDQLRVLKDIVEYELCMLATEGDSQRMQRYLTEVIKYRYSPI